MKNITERLEALRNRIHAAELASHRQPGSVALLAVSKTRTAGEILAAVRAGQSQFGENYLQEALDKINSIADPALTWHFIGPVQSNKTRAIAENFTWVHSIDREKIARRLSEMRPPAMPDLNVCIQVNISNEASKSGVRVEQLPELAAFVSALPRLAFRGLMAMPAPSTQFERQREAFHEVWSSFQDLKSQGHKLDTLSMGTTDDLEAAIAEGSTVVRIGAAIFGARD